MGLRVRSPGSVVVLDNYAKNCYVFPPGVVGVSFQGYSPWLLSLPRAGAALE